jgi:hypothetical protein
MNQQLYLTVTSRLAVESRKMRNRQLPLWQKRPDRGCEARRAGACHDAECDWAHGRETILTKKLSGLPTSPVGGSMQHARDIILTVW